jgi:hypothetical protein
MARPPEGRQVAVVPHTDTTFRLAKRLAARRAQVGFRLHLSASAARLRRSLLHNCKLLNMRILNGINGRYLRENLENAAAVTDFVEAAVAYASADELFEWCWSKAIPLRYWGRFDETIPVSIPLLRTFLARVTDLHLQSAYPFRRQSSLVARVRRLYWFREPFAFCVVQQH